MNINKKYIIIFGISALLIITIFGFKAYYQERESQTIITSPEDISFDKTFDKNYLNSLEETELFNQMCADANVIISKQEPEFEPLLCFLAEDKDYDINGKYTFMPTPLKKMSALPKGQYIAIAVNYSDLLEKNTSIIPSDSSFNICSITKPYLKNSFTEQLLPQDRNFNNNIFSEGEISCIEFLNLPSKTLNLLISGFVPDNDLLETKIYLVTENAITNDLLSEESFSSIEKILQSYPLLWEIEKSII